MVAPKPARSCAWHWAEDRRLVIVAVADVPNGAFGIALHVQILAAQRGCPMLVKVHILFLRLRRLARSMALTLGIDSIEL